MALIGPLLGASMVFHIMPETTGGSISGSNNSVRIRLTPRARRLNSSAIRKPSVSSTTSAVAAKNRVFPSAFQKAALENMLM